MDNVISSNWISVGEKMPGSVHKKILFLCNGEVKYGYHGTKGWWSYRAVNGFCIELTENVTHWTPLPLDMIAIG